MSWADFIWTVLVVSSIVTSGLAFMWSDKPHEPKQVPAWLHWLLKRLLSHRQWMRYLGWRIARERAREGRRSELEQLWGAVGVVKPLPPLQDLAPLRRAVSILEQNRRMRELTQELDETADRVRARNQGMKEEARSYQTVTLESGDSLVHVSRLVTCEECGQQQFRCTCYGPIL